MARLALSGEKDSWRDLALLLVGVAVGASVLLAATTVHPTASHGLERLRLRLSTSAVAEAPAGASDAAPAAPQGDQYAARDALLASWPADRPKAAFVVVARSEDVDSMVDTMRQLAARWQAGAGSRDAYPWVFLNNGPLDDNFKHKVGNATCAPTFFLEIPKEHWGTYPEWIDQERAAEYRRTTSTPKGNIESYHFMCRYFSGFFYRHPFLAPFDYYWRVEPHVQFLCNLRHDPFRYAAQNNISYGWTIMHHGIHAETVKTLWPTVKGYIEANPDDVPADNALRGVLTTDDAPTYNFCHYWSNFEIGAFAWLRSPQHQRFFEHLDRAGGFFYERWGDAEVHTLAASILLRAEQIHRFVDIGYVHSPVQYCPLAYEYADQYRDVCQCDPAHDGNTNGGNGQCYNHLKQQGALF